LVSPFLGREIRVEVTVHIFVHRGRFDVAVSALPDERRERTECISTRRFTPASVPSEESHNEFLEARLCNSSPASTKDRTPTILPVLGRMGQCVVE